MQSEKSDPRSPESAPSADKEADLQASARRRRRQKWGIGMAFLVVVAVVLLLWSALTPYRGTLVELRLIASRAEFEIWPDRSLEAPDHFSLLAPGVQVSSLLLESDAVLEPRTPPPGLMLPTLEARRTNRYQIRARDGEPGFHPQLEVALPVSVTVEARPTAPHRPQRLMLTLRRAPDQQPGVASSDGPGDSDRDQPPSLRFSIGAVDLLLGQRFSDTRLGLSMAQDVNTESTLVQVLNLEQRGEVISEFPLALQLPESWRLIPDGGQAVVLRKVAAGKRPLLHPVGDLRNLRFHHSAAGKLESHLLESEVHFPDGELEPIPVPRGFFLDLAPKDAFSARSFDRVPEGLALTLWGRAESLRIGPSRRYLRQLLPSKLAWLHHRWKKLLIGGILLWGLSTAFTILKMVKP